MRNGRIVSEVWLRDDIMLVLRALEVAGASGPGGQGIEAQAYRQGWLAALQAVGMALVDDRLDLVTATCTRPLLTGGDR